MARAKKEPRRTVVFLDTFTKADPETVLVGRQISDGAEYVIATIPEKVTTYTVGEKLDMGTISRAKEFVKTINALAGKTVCTREGV